MKILIIDDEQDLCILLKDYFDRKNYHVFISNSLADGKQQLVNIRPEVLFLDNNLPDGVGWDSAVEIASAFPGTFIVLISAFHPQIPHMPHAARFTVIEKPFTLHDLDRKLEFMNN